MTHTVTSRHRRLPDATEVFGWTRHGPDYARRAFTGAAVREGRWLPSADRGHSSCHNGVLSGR
jgi:hypothetical protein